MNRRNLGALIDSSRAIIRGNRVDVYWWAKRKNFGDLVTRELLISSGLSPIYGNPKIAKLVCAGSVLEHLPQSFSGDVIGTGLMWGKARPLPQARFRSVRGVLTRDVLGLGSQMPLGDLGLIADRLLAARSTQHKKYHVGIVPHFMDKAHPWLKHMRNTFNGRLLIINVERSARAVAADIVRCDAIVSSSLHGLIFADAFGIPSAWCEFSDKVLGNGFKFRDYGSSIDTELTQFKPDDLMNFSKIERFVQERPAGAVVNAKQSVERVWQQFLKEQRTAA